MRQLKTILAVLVLTLALAPVLTRPAHADLGIIEADRHETPTPTPFASASTSSTPDSTGSANDSSGDSSLKVTILIIAQSLIPLV